jgi:hypothetical protein
MIVCNIYLFGIIYQIFTQTSMVQEQNEQQTKHQMLDNGTIFNIILALVCFDVLVLELESRYEVRLWLSRVLLWTLAERTEKKKWEKICAH